jgi:PAS domain S-box-containing protein
VRPKNKSITPLKGKPKVPCPSGTGAKVTLDGGQSVSSNNLDFTERSRMEEALRESEERFKSLFENAVLGIYRTTPDGQILLANPALCRMLGCPSLEELQQRNLEKDGFHPAYPRSSYKREIEKKGVIIGLEASWATSDGRTVFVRESARAIRDAGGRVLYYEGTVEDITERKRAEEALRESEEKFRSVFRGAGVGMVIVSPEGHFLAANGTFCDYLGYTEEELLVKTVQSVTFHEDWPAFSQKLSDALKEEHSFQRFEKRCLHKTGRIVYTESSASLIRTSQGKPRYFVGEVLDVTKRKESEAALSSVNGRLIQAQEQERVRVARELHDDVSQRLALLAIRLEQVEQEPLASSDLLSHIREMQKEVEELLTNVQNLSHELHSSKLDYLGAVAAIRSWCAEFSEKHGMEINFNSYEVPNSLPSEISFCLFRVLQEALHNAAKHSGVKKVDVKLGSSPNEIHLTVSDLGRGFDIEAGIKGRGLGLTSMQERLRLVNGRLSIDSQPRRGTTIQARVPFDSSAKSARAAS